MGTAIYRNHKDNVFCLLCKEKENMPLRLLHYISEEYRRIVPAKDLYRRTGIRIPTPHFVVFYNGTEPQPEKQVYKLSDLYENTTGDPELEITITVLNVNDGNNTELMEKCRALKGYMKFVNKVRARTSGMDIEKAVRSAVEECIEEDILREFFIGHREEIIEMGIFGFNEELFKEAMYEDGIVTGLKQGRKEGEDLFASLVVQLTKDKRSKDIGRAAEDRQFRKALYKKYQLL